jgi:hypothetical protein
MTDDSKFEKKKKKVVLDYAFKGFNLQSMDILLLGLWQCGLKQW